MGLCLFEVIISTWSPLLSEWEKGTSLPFTFAPKHLATNNFRIIDTQGRTIVNDGLQISEGLNTYRLDYDLNIGFYFLEIDNKKIKIIVQ